MTTEIPHFCACNASEKHTDFPDPVGAMIAKSSVRSTTRFPHCIWNGRRSCSGKTSATSFASVFHWVTLRGVWAIRAIEGSQSKRRRLFLAVRPFAYGSKEMAFGVVSKPLRYWVACLVDVRGNRVSDWVFRGVDGMVGICVSLSKDNEWANAEISGTSRARFLVGGQALGEAFSDIGHSWSEFQILERSIKYEI
jgi:hypothetical protein